MNDDKMRAEFEQWAEDNDCGITLAATSATGFYTRNIAWTAWQAAYQAGRKAEREAMQREREEWSKSVHKRWIETRTRRGWSVTKLNVGEAIEEARQFGEQEPKDMLFAEHIAIFLAAEVERLRAELAAAKAEIESVIRLGPHPVEQVQMPLATFVETRFVPVWQYNELADKLERTRAELAAAKAASVVPEESAIWLLAVAAKLEKDGESSGLDSMTKAANWLRDRMKDTTPPGA